MAWTATVEEATGPVPEGEYIATATDIRNAEGPHGPMVRIDFTLTTDNEHDGRQVSGLASKRMSENTKLGRWITAILGRVPEVGAEVTSQDLIGKDCRITVKHRTNPDGKTFANVADVLPQTDPL